MQLEMAYIQLRPISVQIPATHQQVSKALRPLIQNDRRHEQFEYRKHLNNIMITTRMIKDTKG